MPVAIPAWIVALIVGAFFLREARTLFVPLALAMLASYALRPVVGWFDRVRVPRGVSAAVVVGLIFASAGWLGWALSDDAARLVRELPGQLRQVRSDLQRSATGGVLDDLTAAAAEIDKGASGGAQAGASRPAPSASAGFSNYFWQGSTSLFGLMGHVMIVGFLTYFLLVGDEAWHGRLVRVSGTVLSSRRTGAEVLGEIAEKIQRILWTHVITSVVVGVATGLALTALGGPAPWVWAVVAGVFNWVPYFGPVVVSGGLLIVGFVTGGAEMAATLALTALAITSLEGWVLTPLLMGRAVRVNTVAVFVSLMFWSWAWGIWGTILAVPVTSVIKVVADHVEPLRWLSQLLSEDQARDLVASRAGRAVD